jgi:hypothetical protein
MHGSIRVSSLMTVSASLLAPPKFVSVSTIVVAELWIKEHFFVAVSAELLVAVSTMPPRVKY